MASNSIHKNRTRTLMLRAFANSSLNEISKRRLDTVSWSPSGAYFRHRLDYIGFRKKMKQPKFFDYYMDLRGLEPARFTIEEFNKLKNAELEFVGVVKAHRHLLST